MSDSKCKIHGEGCGRMVFGTANPAAALASFVKAEAEGGCLTEARLRAMAGGWSVQITNIPVEWGIAVAHTGEWSENVLAPGTVWANRWPSPAEAEE